MRRALIALMVSFSSVAHSIELSDVRINGFLTAAMAVSDEDLATYHEITETPTFNSDSIAAVQIEADINDQVTASIQLLARGLDDYKVEADWIFLSYRAQPDFSVRACRMRLPSYMLSDYVEVGYAYPWVRPPHTVYGLVPIFTFDGVDLFYKKSFGEWSVTAQPFYGSSDKTVSIQGLKTDVSLSDVWGLTLSLSNGWATFRVGHTEYDVDLTISHPAGPLQEEGKKASLSGVGMELKWNQWVSMAEYTQRYTQSQFVPDINGWYVMGGYRVGDWLPNLTFASGRNNNSVDDQREQDSVIAGVRWDVKDNMAIKFETEIIDVKNGSLGGISYPEDMTVWTIAIDAVF